MHNPGLYVALVSFLILTSHLVPILSTTITPYEIDDLYATDEASFRTEASSWVASPTQLTTYIYSPCGGTFIVGGYGVGAGSNQESISSYYGRIYYGLAPHTMIYFSFQLWALDTWDISGSDGPDGGDGFHLYFSGTALAGFPMDQNTFTVNECGSSDPDSVMTIQGQVQHISTILEFRIYNHFDEDSENESLGIRQITFMMSDAPAQANSICSPDTPNLSYRCTNSCPDGYYWNGIGCAACDYYCSKCFGSGTTNCYQCRNGAVWDGSECIICSSNCATCYGGEDDQCLTCSAAYPYMYNENTCLASCAYPLAITGSVCGLPCPENQYLYPDGTCLVDCDFPLEAITTTTPVGVVNMCISPCSGSDYMYWEADCRATCNFPLTAITQYGINYCEFPCDPSTLILYWNGTCETSCDFPLEYANRFSAAFCDYPCADNEYLYDNGTCSSICQQYFLTNAVDDPSGKLYCYYPCSSTQTLYNNGSCLGTCDWRFTNYTLWPDWYCDYPCTSTQYLYTNGSCLGTCDPRFGLRVDSVTGDKYCDYPCDDNLYLDSNGTCTESCDNFFYPYYLWEEMYCDYPCQSTQYLLNNGTCVDNCNSDYPYFNSLSVSGLPLRTGVRVVETYCSYPCLPNEYLYSNGSCLTSCRPLYIPSIYSRDKFCDYPCESTEYLYYNGSCLDSCPGIFDSYPLTPPSSELYCANPCKPPDFIYPNGTCLSYCTIPYVQEFYGADSYCIFPCSTTTPIEYLYINGSCESTCLSYYSQRIEGDEHFCDYPCEPEDHLYYNHTCLSSCKSPFVLNVVNGENFCDYPCTTTSDFIYWNGSCISSCSEPLQSVYEGTSNFCNYPCESDQFLYWTGVCLGTCPFPLSTITTNDGFQYCNNPCSASEYLAWNGSCLSQCSEPFRTQDNGLGLRCELPCDDSDYYYNEDTKECSSTCDGDVTLEQDIYLSCGSPSASIAFLEFLSTPPTERNTITYIMLADPIKYLRYLDITMSPRLERLALSQGKAPISLLYNHGVPSEIESQLSQSIRTRLLAQTEVEVPASFLVNFWPEILMLAIFVFCAALFTLAGELADRLRLEEVRVLLERFRVVFKWNIPLILLSTTLGDVILYSSFEFETLNLDSAVAVISMLICIIFILTELLVIIAGYFLAPRAYTLKANSLKTQSYKDYAAFLLKWEGFQVIYRGFAVDHKLCYYFFLFYTVRMALPMLIAAYLPSPPLLQTMLFLIISIIAILYLHFFRPLRKKITRIQFMISELLMLFVNVGLVILASLDLNENNSNSTSAVIVIGDIIVVLSFCLCILPTVFLIIKLTSIGLAAYRLRKVAPEQSEALWMQMIFLPIQQAGFGFEQVQIARHSTKYTKIDNLNLTKISNDNGSSTEREEFGQTHLYNVNNPAKRMKVPEIIKSNIKQPHEKDYKPEYRTFAPKAIADETIGENPDPFWVSHDLPRQKDIGRDLGTNNVTYAHVYGATKGFGRVDEL